MGQIVMEQNKDRNKVVELLGIADIKEKRNKREEKARQRIILIIFIHSFNKYFLNDHHVTGTILNA